VKITYAVLLLVPQVAVGLALSSWNLRYFGQPVPAEDRGGRKFQGRKSVSPWPSKVANPEGAVRGANADRTPSLCDEFSGLSS
jgi:hypothetical protein